MNEVLKAILFQTLGYFMAMVIPLFLIGFWQRGFLIKFLKVKASFGRKILILLKKVNRIDYETGVIREGFLVFTVKDDRGEKQTKRISISPPFIGKTLQVQYCIVDDEKNLVLSIDFSKFEGFDAIKWNNLYLRALTRPLTKKDIIIIIVLIVAIIAALASMFSGYFSSQVPAKISTVQSICQACLNKFNTTTVTVL